MAGNEKSNLVYAAWHSETGRIRKNNQDRSLVSIDRNLFIVSDGMGGHQAGGVASQAVVTILPELIDQRLAGMQSSGDQEMELILRESLLELSQRLWAESTGEEALRGMGATVALVWISGSQAHLAHMGDSRVYLFRHDHLLRQTEDHSIVTLLVKHGDITLAEAKNHPARGRLSRFVGMEGEVYADVRTLNLQANDRLLLCTDGLTSMVPDEWIEQVLGKYESPDDTCRELTKAALDAGGNDNVTVIIMDYLTRPQEEDIGN
jgi:serine/threonine protein phosphatase PrpC